MNQVSPSATSLHHSQLEPFHALADELPHGARQRGAEIAQTLQHSQHLDHFKSFSATEKSCVNRMFQLVLKSPLHLLCGHVLSVLHSVLVQGTSAPPLGVLCMPQALGDSCLHGAGGRCPDTYGSSHLLLLHLQTCTALEVALKMWPIMFSTISAVNNDSCP